MDCSVTIKMPAAGTVTITASLNVGHAAENLTNFGASVFHARVVETFSGKVDMPNLPSQTQKYFQLPKH